MAEKPPDAYESHRMEEYLDEIEDSRALAADIENKYTTMPRSLRRIKVQRYGRIEKKKVHLKLDKDGLDVAEPGSDSDGLDTELEEDSQRSSDGREQVRRPGDENQNDEQRQEMVMSILTESTRNEIKRRIGEIFYKMLFLNTVKSII